MKKITKFLIGVLFLVFTAQSLFYAFEIRPGTYPDENYHSGLSFLHAKSENIFLKNSEETRFFGNVEDIPFLYHTLGGAWLSLNIFPISDFYFLRILSVLLAIGTILFAFGIFRRLSKNETIQILALVFMTNFLFFNYFSAAISYDAFTNFCAVGMIFFFLRFFQRANFWNFFGFSLFLFFGNLTKITFLPLAAFLGIFFLGLFFQKNTRDEFFTELLSQKILWLFGSIIVVLGIFTIGFYGKNILEFGHIIPNCEQKMSHEECLKNYMYRREFNRKNEEKIKNNYRFDFFGYSLEWAPLLFERVTGIVAFQKFCQNEKQIAPTEFSNDENFFAQSQISPPKWMQNIFQGLVLFTIFLSLFSLFSYFTKTKIPWKYEKISPEIIISITILLFYILVIFLVNYSIYLESGNLFLALHGRYILPILPLFSFFIAFFLLQNFSKKGQIWIAIIISFFLIAQNFPSFLLHEEHYHLEKDTNWIPKAPCTVVKNICEPLDPTEWKMCESENIWQFLEK